MVPVKKKTKAAVLAATLAAFALVLGAALLLSRGAGSDRVQSGEHPLRISEYMSANTAYPNADGRICDWIEIHNASDKPFNVSGYRLSDDVTRSRYAFPVGTVIPADGYIVVYCDPERSGGMYAPFSLRRLGGETLLLMNSANTVLDEIETLRCRKNTSIVRSDDGSFTVSAAPTPGYANTDEGYAAYLAASGQGTGALRLSEIMAAEKLFTAPDGTLCDWIEIENTGTETADLSGMHLSDKEGEARYTFPDGTTLAPGAFTVVWCSGDGAEGGSYAAIRIAKAGESVILTDADGNALDRIQTPFLPDDTSYARVSGEWCVTNRPTPGYANTDEGYAAFAAERGFGDVSVQITEVCLRGETLYRDADGDASDWIELYNAGTEGVSLGGWYLSDDPDEPARWRIPDIMLAPGEYRVIFASGKNRTQGELHTDFALSAGESVVLTTPIGSTADRVELTLTEPDASLALLGGEWRECASPTPGKANG